MKQIILSLITACVPMLASTSYLSVDFQQTGDTVQSGFQQFAGGTSFSSMSVPFATSGGTVTVTLNIPIDANDLGGGLFDRGGLSNSGAFTYASLYNSFAYNNSSCSFCASATTVLDITLSGTGISASTPYFVQFYSFDPDTGRSFTGTHTVTLSGTSGTTGTAGQVVWADNAPPTSNDQYSATSVYTSDGSGNLNFILSDSYVSNTDSRSGVRLNALVINLAPEPSTFGLIGFGVAGLALLRARRGNARRDQ